MIENRMRSVNDATLLLSPQDIKIVKNASKAATDSFNKRIANHCWYCILPFCSAASILVLIFLLNNEKFKLKKDIPLFYHLPATKLLQCSNLFDSSKASKNYAKKLTKYRITYQDDLFQLPTDCASIKRRGYFPEEASSSSSLSKDEREFPIAFARIIYKDYYFIESQFRIEYASQNSFCYFLDSKADNLFKKRIRNFASCFNNVIVPDEEIDVQSEGHNMTMAHLICLKHLRNRNWKYVILLQNHDVRLKTNAEIVKIFKAFGGANDISASMPGTHTFNKSTNWTFAALNLFKHDAFNHLKDSSGQLFALNLTKSLVQVSISREAVEFVLDELNVVKFIEKIEEKKFGVDELFWGTLNADEAIQLPGGFTRNCIVNDTKVFMATRLTVWTSEKYPIIPCSTNYFRRWVCIFGVEDLENLENMHHLYVNKLMGEFDFAAVQCLLERVYNRTYFSQNYSISNFDESAYQNLPHVRYHFRKNTGLSLENFNCTRSSKF